MNPATDRELLLAYVRNSDDLAFSQLVGRHADLVFGSAFRLLNDRGAAEEVTQNVFTALARKAHWLTGEGGLAGWLYRTTVLEARLRRRTDLRRRERERLAIELGTTMKQDDSSLNTWVPLLDDGLMELSEKERQALIYRFLEGKSLREVGAATGTGEDAAQKRVRKGLERLTHYFRKHGVAAATASDVARLLQAAGTAAPAELVTTLASGALAAAAGTSLPALGVWIANLMGLTKLQVAALCVLISAAPVGIEWNAAAQARREKADVEHRFAQAQIESVGEQNQSARARRRVAALEASIASAEREQARLDHLLVSARPWQEPGLYLWSEASEYVRLPKSLASKIVLSSSHDLEGAFPVQRDQPLPVGADGTVSGALKAALAITDLEENRLQDAFGDLTSRYQEAEKARRYETNVPPAELHVGAWPSRTVVTQAAPPEQVEETREQFRQQLAGVLGEDRAAIFWNQADGTFRSAFNDFGGIETIETVAFHEGRDLETFNLARRAGETQTVSFGSSYGPLTLNSVPEKLRHFVQEWRSQHPIDQTAESQP